MLSGLKPPTYKRLPQVGGFSPDMPPQFCTLDGTGSSADKAIWSSPVAIQNG
jgi:hypothetical protein